MANKQVIPPASEMRNGGEGFKPGKYPGMPRADYDAVRAVSGSMLKDWVKEKKTTMTRQMLPGLVLHDWVIGTDLYNGKYPTSVTDKYTIIKNVDLTTKEGKALRKDTERDTGKIAVKNCEFAMVQGMFDSLASHKVGRKYIDEQAERELAVFSHFGHKDSSILPKHPTMVKGIIDFMKTNIWDLKTSGCVSIQEFRNSIVKFGYDWKAAWYRELAASICGGEYKQFFWLVVLKKHPHEVEHIEATPYMMATGVRWINEKLALYERFSDMEASMEVDRIEREVQNV